MSKRGKAIILQSGYIPWLGYFSLINEADVFVFLDDVQWTTRDWRNRNRIRTPQGWNWLTTPAKLEKSYFEYYIKDVEIDNSQNWQEKHLNIMRTCYKKALYYHEVYPIFESILTNKQNFIIDLNYELIFTICNYLGIGKTRFLFSQEMNIPREIKKTERLLAIVKQIGGIATYISGPTARSYLEETKFKENGITVEWHEYSHPYYNQNTWRSGFFISHLSIVDLLFNHGKESLSLLTHHTAIKKPEYIKVVLPDEYRRSVLDKEGGGKH